jgi:hypothetical protein
VSGDRHIVLDVWIAIEKLMSPAPDEGSGKQKADRSESESDTQRGNARLFNHRHQQRTIGFHTKKSTGVFYRCYDASVGFSDAAEEWIASPSLEGGVQSR